MTAFGRKQTVSSRAVNSCFREKQTLKAVLPEILLMNGRYTPKTSRSSRAILSGGK
jgi:hypothetical protein